MEDVGTYNRLILTTGHLSAQMSSGQDKAVICPNILHNVLVHWLNRMHHPSVPRPFF
jgi:hypothetical protein